MTGIKRSFADDPVALVARAIEAADDDRLNYGVMAEAAIACLTRLGLRVNLCSTCGQSMDGPGCSKSPGRSGGFHTIGGGVAKAADAAPVTSPAPSGEAAEPTTTDRGE